MVAKRFEDAYNAGMPWSGKQHRLFEAAAHSAEVSARVGIPQGKAREMAGEGVKAGGALVSKGSRKGQMLAALLRRRG